MQTMPRILLILLVVVSLRANAQVTTKFMGRTITVIHPQREDGDGGIFFPKGPAMVCLEAPPRRQCYTPPKEFGNDPQVKVVQLKKDVPAILFSAASGGVSGWEIHFALLRAGTQRDLESSFMQDVRLSNQSQH